MVKSKLNIPPPHPLTQVAEVELIYKSKVRASDRLRITMSRQAYEVLMQVYDMGTIDYRESFWVLYLNQASRVLGAHLISVGGITGTVVDTRNVFQGALLANACSIILSHNHPSGNLSPSEADKIITRSIAEAGKLLDIPLKDHLIVSTDGYYSFADEGQI